MEDAVGEISFGVELQLEESGEESTYAVTVSADNDWLDADDRVYPVRIDPTAIQVGKVRSMWPALSRAARIP